MVKMPEETKSKLNELAKKRAEAQRDLDKATKVKDKYEILRRYGKAKTKIMRSA